jgi:hypothetical protein
VPLGKPGLFFSSKPLPAIFNGMKAVFIIGEQSPRSYLLRLMLAKA